MREIPYKTCSAMLLHTEMSRDNK